MKRLLGICLMAGAFLMPGCKGTYQVICPENGPESCIKLNAETGETWLSVSIPHCSLEEGNSCLRWCPMQ
ncbi:MAG: hypothetical protein ABSF48_23830 [Thermodesulfobacteriota bacterium]